MNKAKEQKNKELIDSQQRKSLQVEQRLKTKQDGINQLKRSRDEQDKTMKKYMEQVGSAY